MNEFYIVEKIICELMKEVSLYEELYGNEESVEKLNSSFPQAFSIFQQAMFFEIVCRISALFDPAQMRSSKNLTISHLVDLCADNITKELVLEVEAIKYDFKVTGIKDLRNKVYAHNDLKKYLGKKELSTNISYESVMDLLDGMFKVVRSMGIESKMVDPAQTIARDTKIPKFKSGVTLVNELERA